MTSPEMMNSVHTTLTHIGTGVFTLMGTMAVGGLVEDVYEKVRSPHREKDSIDKLVTGVALVGLGAATITGFVMGPSMYGAQGAELENIANTSARAYGTACAAITGLFVGSLAEYRKWNEPLPSERGCLGMILGAIAFPLVYHALAYHP